MTIYEITTEKIVEAMETSFADEGIKERTDLQRLIIEKIDIISKELMVITEEFGEWEESNRRIDILAIDKDAKLVVIELKRTQEGGHMELQAIRYAAMISTLTFDQTVEIYQNYLAKTGKEVIAREDILNFLEWEEPDEDSFANDVRIILVSADFSKEITTSVMWLNSRDLDITCIRLKPYKLEDKTLLDVQQIIPLPEAEEYQIKVKEKDKKQREKKWEQKPMPVIWQELEQNCSGEEFVVIKKIHDWLELNVTKIFTTSNGFAPELRVNNRNQYFLKVQTNGNIVLWFQYLANKLPFSDETLRLNLLEKLNTIPNLNIPESKIKGKPSFPVKVLLDDNAFKLFQEAFNWVFSVMKSEEHSVDG
jgi:RecB family endonuclease NucS